MNQSTRLIAEKIRDDLKNNMGKNNAESLVEEVKSEDKKIIYNLK